MATIADYVNGTPSGTTSTATNDDDIYTRYVYANGHMTRMHVDFDGDGNVDTDDQVTKYIYGTTAGTPSPMVVSTGHLLRAVIYPDSSNPGTTSAYIDGTSDADVVSYAYNAQGQQVYMKDQAGNIIETVYDTAGRQTDRCATNIETGAGFDDRVKRIETSYLPRGVVDRVKQYNDKDPGEGTALDEVRYGYDDWGNLTSIEQDPDSAIGGSGRDSFTVGYTCAKATPTNGRVAWRRTAMTYPNLSELGYDYGSANAINDCAGRVQTLVMDAVDVATYQYLGAGQVVTTNLPEPDVTSSVYTGSGTYTRLDRFNRVLNSRWERTGLAAFYNVDITYNEDSGIEKTIDNVHTWTDGEHLFDYKYTNDGLNRPVHTKESKGRVDSRGSMRRRTTLSRHGNVRTAVEQLRRRAIAWVCCGVVVGLASTWLASGWYWCLWRFSIGRCVYVVKGALRLVIWDDVGPVEIRGYSGHETPGLPPDVYFGRCSDFREHPYYADWKWAPICTVRQKDIRVQLPFWVIILCPLFLLAVTYRCVRAANAMACLRCGYCRTGLTATSPCPECGTSAPSSSSPSLAGGQMVLEKG